MFAGAKQGSTFRNRSKLSQKLCLRSNVNPAIIHPSVNHRKPAVLTYSKLCLRVQDFNDETGFG